VGFQTTFTGKMAAVGCRSGTSSLLTHVEIVCVEDLVENYFLERQDEGASCFTSHQEEQKLEEVVSRGVPDGCRLVIRHLHSSPHVRITDQSDI
jgi:hypothetical protein